MYKEATFSAWNHVLPNSRNLGAVEGAISDAGCPTQIQTNKHVTRSNAKKWWHSIITAHWPYAFAAFTGASNAQAERFFSVTALSQGRRSQTNAELLNTTVAVQELGNALQYYGFAKAYWEPIQDKYNLNLGMVLLVLALHSLFYTASWT